MRSLLPFFLLSASAPPAPPSSERPSEHPFRDAPSRAPEDGQRLSRRLNREGSYWDIEDVPSKTLRRWERQGRPPAVSVELDRRAAGFVLVKGRTVTVEKDATRVEAERRQNLRYFRGYRIARLERVRLDDRRAILRVGGTGAVHELEVTRAPGARPKALRA